MTEQINGDVFLSLNDEILEHELGVKSKIHRIKIMRIVMGKQSLVEFNLQY